VTPAQHARLMDLFDQACELPRDEAARFVAGLTGDDVPLKAELQAMLDADRTGQVFFDQTRGGAVALAKDLLESALEGVPRRPDGEVPMPARVGEYELLERLGAGGMGSVYKARQKDPDRVVALKMLHPWLVSPASLERFRFEAQALASLQHPSIPPVFTVGQHEGVVYFAMELVSGPSLSGWAKARSPSLDERVTMLCRICEAVHHAHLRGFVHRDLKPDNVRVTDDGTPQVLDFGISAGLGQHQAEVAGTPAYMSPEQLDPLAPVDVRTDVFALGVIAFELFAGRLPVVPPKSGLATLLALKREPAPRLASVVAGLGGELDAIVARALEVEPARRYASAAELGADLRRFHEHRPVHAYDGGPLYRAGRFVRRNRLLVGAAAAVTAALILGVGVSLSEYLKAEAARARAATDAERAKASLEFLTSVLQEADADNAGGRGATIGQAIDRAAKNLESHPLDPHVEAVLRASMANTYVGLGEWRAADAQAHLALEAYEKNHLADDEDLGEVLRVVTEVREESGDVKGAAAAGERCLALEERLHGPGVHPHLSYSLHSGAIALREAERFPESVAWHERAVDMERALAVVSGATNDLCDTIDQYALTLTTLGRFEEAERLFRESLAMNVKQFGPDHQTPAIEYHHLAWMEFERGAFAEAQPWFEKSLAVRLAKLGPDHMRVGMLRYLETRLALARGDLAAAEVAMTDCERICQKSYGGQFGRYARLENGRVLLLAAQGKGAEALALADKAYGFLSEKFGPRHYVAQESRGNRAVALLALGRRDEAIAEWKDIIATLTPVVGPKARITREAIERLALAEAKTP
jgi:tetratricopeptide (TPR) repeat protein/tRNA A-37 threonylcarbamoyl transferase component Bud32